MAKNKIDFKPHKGDGPQAPQVVIQLFQSNLAAMRLWYRSAETPGPEAGINVVHELVLANVMTALELAIEGKEWVAP